MARIAGVNIPDNKHAVISLTYILVLVVQLLSKSLLLLVSKKPLKLVR